MTQRLQNKIILVTGASNGIGREAALSYARHGATVILLGRNIPRLEACYDAICEQTGNAPAIYPFHLGTASPKDFEDLAKTLEENFERLDGILHSAAMLGSLTPLEHYDLKLWYEVFQTNLHAPFLLTRACLNLLKRSESASVIFTEDSSEACGRAYWGAYGISKFGLAGLRQVLAEELENTTVRVNSIYPGKVRTTLRASAYPGIDPEQSPPPSAIMPAYVYLMGPESCAVSGECVDAQKFCSE